jgi:hypothetical protein
VKEKGVQLIRSFRVLVSATPRLTQTPTQATFVLYLERTPTWAQLPSLELVSVGIKFQEKQDQAGGEKYMATEGVKSRSVLDGAVFHSSLAGDFYGAGGEISAEISRAGPIEVKGQATGVGLGASQTIDNSGQTVTRKGLHTGAGWANILGGDFEIFIGFEDVEQKK